MRTLASSRHERPWRRDLKLLVQIGRMLLGYRALEARGETFWVDEDGPRDHREAALRR
jgi:hypothetical protein